MSDDAHSPLVGAVFDVHRVEAPAGGNDFAATAHAIRTLSPEIDWLRILTGSVSGAVPRTATDWGNLSDNMDSIAGSYGSRESRLLGATWVGPISATMAATATDIYVRWMRATARCCEQMEAHARTVRAAYEAAFAMPVRNTDADAGATLRQTMSAIPEALAALQRQGHLGAGYRAYRAEP